MSYQSTHIILYNRLIKAFVGTYMPTEVLLLNDVSHPGYMTGESLRYQTFPETPLATTYFSILGKVSWS